MKIWRESKCAHLVNCGAPTACSWIPTDPCSFVVGDSAHLLLCNANSNSQTRISFAGGQSNSIVTSESGPIVVSGHEDKCIRLFDLREKCCTKAIVAHSEAVSSVDMHDNGNLLVSGGCDGSVRSWDLRTMHCLYEIPAHRRKYDQAVNVVKVHPTKTLLAAGGADSIIKLFESR